MNLRVWKQNTRIFCLTLSHTKDHQSRGSRQRANRRADGAGDLRQRLLGPGCRALGLCTEQPRRGAGEVRGPGDTRSSSLGLARLRLRRLQQGLKMSPQNGTVRTAAATWWQMNYVGLLSLKPRQQSSTCTRGLIPALAADLSSPSASPLPAAPTTDSGGSRDPTYPHLGPITQLWRRVHELEVFKNFRRSTRDSLEEPRLGQGRLSWDPVLQDEVRGAGAPRDTI